MKLIIAGGRDMTDYSFVKKSIQTIEFEEIVSGGARGIDSLGERYAKEENIDLVTFHANWGKYGKAAGFIRNQKMADYADGLLAIWDGKSKGTKNMIEIARKSKLRLWVCKYGD